MISLILQAVGGGIAASSPEDVEPVVGNNLMLSGIIFQLISQIIFLVFAIDMYIRVQIDKPYSFRMPSHPSLDRQTSDESVVIRDAEKQLNGTARTDPNLLRNWTIMLGGVLVSSLCIIIRGIYRSAELSQGWGESIMLNEKLQIFLDGMMMVIAVGVFNFLHPLWLLPKKEVWRGFR
jgi:hypothetical protein